MDRFDVMLKFSSELLVICLVLIVGFLNVIFFKFGTGKAFSDNSHAFNLLSYHTEFNPKYYGRETSISTVLYNNDQRFISQAKADDFEGLSEQNFTLPAPTDELKTITEQGLINPNPDSIKELVSTQIITYTTQPGDSLQSVANKYNISVQTILDANNILVGTMLKPGWKLDILPVDGIRHIADSNDTLPDIAKKYSGNLEAIISYNGLANAEDITEGQIIIVPGGKLPVPVNKKPQPSKSQIKQSPVDRSKVGGNSAVENVISEVGSGYDSAAHIFPKGYCTWYVAQKIHIPWGGNAKAWLKNARNFGAVVDMEPARGTIVVTNDSARYGHVAYVESVNDDGTITVSEMNYEKFGKINWRTISLSSSSIKGFIHP